MKYIEKHPMIMIVVGILGISLSAIFVKYSTAPSAVTAAFRLCWTVLLMSPVVWGKKDVREELLHVNRKEFGLSVGAQFWVHPLFPLSCGHTPAQQASQESLVY